MKSKYLQLFTTILAAGLLAAGCIPSVQLDEEVADPVITVATETVQASWEGQIFEIPVESNCSWNISKTDADGATIKWVKCDMAGGSGNLTLRVRVYRNGTADERRATVTLFHGDIKAFIDVKQEGNPDPDKPDEPDTPPTPPDPPTPPTGDVVNLTFDFTIDPLDGWPTAGGYAHVDGGIECIYPLGGYNYTFILADCNGASQSTVYWVPAKDDASPRLSLTNQYRYLGLPALEGYKLTQVVCHNLALASNTPKIGITKVITESARHPTESEYVSGGELQTWDAAGGGTYTYDLTDTEVNTVYYIYTYVKAALGSIDLKYEKEQTEPPVEEDKVLLFDFSVTPLEGWPTAGGYSHTEGGITCVYPLDGTDYSFILADCGAASAAQMFWAVTDPGPRLAFGAQYRYLGLPAIEDYKLIKVKCVSVLLNASSATISPKIYITDSIAASAADAKAFNDDSDAVVSGGKSQLWDPNGGTYTYELTGTEANKVYYIYAQVKGAVTSIELTYTK